MISPGNSLRFIDETAVRVIVARRTAHRILRPVSVKAGGLRQRPNKGLLETERQKQLEARQRQGELPELQYQCMGY